MSSRGVKLRAMHDGVQASDWVAANGMNGTPEGLHYGRIVILYLKRFTIIFSFVDC